MALSHNPKKCASKLLGMKAKQSLKKMTGFLVKNLVIKAIITLTVTAMSKGNLEPKLLQPTLVVTNGSYLKYFL